LCYQNQIGSLSYSKADPRLKIRDIMASESEYDHSVFGKVGAVCWMEIPAIDLDRAKTFYGTLFGWEFSRPSEMGMEDNGSYLMFHKKGTSVHGGFTKVDSAEKLVSPKETGYVAVRVSVCVEEVGKTLEEVKKHGGEVVKPKTEIGSNMGYSGLFRDTEGNVNGIWSKE